MLGRVFERKKSAQLVIPVRSTFQNDFQKPVGGPHPVLYFTTQRNVAQQCAIADVDEDERWCGWWWNLMMKDDVDDDEGWGGWWWRRDLIAMKTNPLLDPSCSHTFGSGTSAMPKVFFYVFVVFLVLHTVYNSWWICICIVLYMVMVRVFLNI